MERKVQVPATISLLIRQMGLSRSLLVKLLCDIHDRIPKDYPTFRRFRVQGEEEDRQCRHRFVIEDAGRRHLFTFTIEDATSPDHLILVYIRHDVRD